MWEIYQDSGSIRLAQAAGQRGYLLVFADEPMLLVPVTEDSSGDLGRESLTPVQDISTQRSRSRRKSRK